MRCTIIGSWGGCCKQNEACSGYLLTHQGFHLLLDCGSGVASVVQNVTSLNEIHHIVLTHYHYDHCSDAGALCYARLVNTQIGMVQQPLRLYGLPLEPDFSRLTMAPYTQGHAIAEGQCLNLGPFCCTFLRTSHPVDCVAVRVECAGQSLVYTGDSAYFPGLADFARGASLLIAECSLFPGFDGAGAGHMSSVDVARLAAEAHPDRLLISHLPLYGDPGELLKDVRTRWTGWAELAEKLLVIDLDGEKEAQKT